MRYTFLSAALMVPAMMFGQAKYTAPKTPWGDPDLQGLWPAAANIPMQRPANLGDRSTLSKEEYERQVTLARQRDEADQQEFAPSAGGVTINPPGYWVERAKPHEQTSLVVDPPDGRVPPLTPSGRDVVKSLRGGLGPGQHFPEKVDSYEDFDFYSRCISRGLVSSMLPTLYNYGNLIVQGPGYVAITYEMVHEARVIPLTSAPHPGERIRMYMGDAKGHWEGNTLVVETTNFTDKIAYRGSSEHLKLTERFTRTGPDSVEWSSTFDDAHTWATPWTFAMTLSRKDDSQRPFEYACHEGNYAMFHLLEAQRAEDKAVAEDAKKGIVRARTGGTDEGER